MVIKLRDEASLQENENKKKKQKHTKKCREIQQGARLEAVTNGVERKGGYVGAMVRKVSSVYYDDRLIW